MPLAALLADAVATWTDKEVLLAIGGTVGALIPVTLFVAKIARDLGHAAARRRRAPPPVSDQPAESAPDPTLTRMHDTLEAVQKELMAVGATSALHQDKAESFRLNVERLKTDLTQLQSQVDQAQADVAERDRRIKRATCRDGQIWNEKVLSNAPAFKPLEPEGRRTPILSVLNLKGGVGKTTVTANLANALTALGYKVLLLDLDLQGSLTGLFLSDADQEAIAKKGGMLEDFLDKAFDAEFPNILDYTRPLFGGRGAIVPTADSLAYAEANLMIRWLLREGNRDPRFLLRKELHLKRVTNEYDVVLMDCPPLINVSCVNALAASDYLLVPVTPSRQATARVPVLLQRVKAFRENINPELKVMGVLANRTYGESLTAAESNRLTLLTAQCKDVWGDTVRRIEVIVRHNQSVLRAEDEGRPLAEEDPGADAFRRLAEEVEGLLPTFCRPAPAGKAVKEKEAVS